MFCYVQISEKLSSPGDIVEFEIYNKTIKKNIFRNDWIINVIRCYLYDQWRVKDSPHIIYLKG